VDVLKDVATELTFADRLDEIERKLSSQLILQGDLKDFSLRLLRALLGSSLKILNLFVQLRDGVLAVLHFQVKAGMCLTAGISASLFEPGGDSLLQVEGKLAFLVPKLLFFP